MRVKRGVASHRKHVKLLKQTKGMSKIRRSSIKKAREAVLKALSYGYRDRRTKKRDFRSLWITRINAGLQQSGISYSAFTGRLAKANIELDRKILSELATNQPEVFNNIVDSVK